MSQASIGEQQLRALYGEPRDLVREAWAPELEATTRAFIQASPFMVLSSVNAEGFVDTSPLGGPLALCKWWITVTCASWISLATAKYTPSLICWNTVGWVCAFLFPALKKLCGPMGLPQSVMTWR